MEDHLIQFEEPLEVTLYKYFPDQFKYICTNGKLVDALNRFEGWVVDDFLDIRGSHCDQPEALARVGGLPPNGIRDYQAIVRLLVSILAEVPSFAHEQDVEGAIRKINGICEEVGDEIQRILQKREISENQTNFHNEASIFFKN